MSKSLLNKISYFVSIISIAVAGLFFILLTDLELGLGAMWLFIAIIFAFGSSVCGILSDNYKEQPKKMFILKGVSLGLAVCFIGFMFIYLSSGMNGVKDGLFMIKKYTSQKNKFYCTFSVIVSVVIGAISVAGNIINIILTAKLKDE